MEKNDVILCKAIQENSKGRSSNALVLQLIKLFALQLRCARNQHRVSLPALQLAVQLALKDQRAAAAK